MANPQPKIAKVYKKVKLHEQETDYAYWQSQSYLARLEALAQIRSLYIDWKYDSPPGFQRILSIIKQK